MNNRISLIFSFLFLCTSLQSHLHSQMKERLNKTDLELLGLKDSVKAIEIRKFEPTFLNRAKTKYTLQPADFLGLDNYDIEFDNLGYLIRKIFWNYKNNVLKTISSLSLIYDDKHKISKEIFMMDNSNEQKINTFTYPEPNIVRVKTYSFSELTNKLEYSGNSNYSFNGDIETYSYVNSDSTFFEKKIFTYDNFNRIINIKNISNNDIKEERLIKYLHDKNNQKHSEKFIDYKNNFTNTDYYEYNDKGDIINFKSSKGNIFLHNKYKYDEKKNWIEKSVFNNKNILVEVIRRKISYY